MRTISFALVSSLAMAGMADAGERPMKDPAVKEAVGQVAARYGKCIHDEGERLEPSGEPADTVASAAITSCKSWRQKTLEMIMLNGMVNFSLKADSAAQVGENVLTRLEREARQQVVLNVMETRTTAKSLDAFFKTPEAGGPDSASAKFLKDVGESDKPAMPAPK